MAGRIFFSYRRDTNAAAAGRLYDRLLQSFGRHHLFMDVEGIEPGVDFVRALNERLSECGALVAIIGPGWLDAKNRSGRRRLDDPNDYVRLEIETALNRDIRVIPVLVDGAQMPQASELPSSLGALARRQGVEISHARFASDTDVLAGSLQRALGIQAPPPGADRLSIGLVTPASNPGWGNLLFSFNGRLARKPYWIASVGLLIAALIYGFLITAALAAVMLAAGIPEGTVTSNLQSPSGPIKLLFHIASLPLYWPATALSLKRLHDVGQGWGLLTPLIVLGVVAVGLDIAGNQQGFLMAWVSSIAAFGVIGCIKGTPGPNQYGPDPLGNRGSSAGGLAAA